MKRLLIAALMVASTAIAHAAEAPSAGSAPLLPARAAAFPSEVVGVVGSGDQLSLQLKVGGNLKTVAVGDLYQPGWRLQALTDSVATFSNEGRIQHIGLNPTGIAAIAQPPTGATKVMIIAGSVPELLNQARAIGLWDGGAKPGLTMDQTQRYLVYLMRGRDRIDPNYPYLGNEMLAMSPEDRADYLALNDAYLDGVRVERFGGQIADFERFGPVRLYVPPGASPAQVFTEAGMGDAAISHGSAGRSGRSDLCRGESRPHG